MPKTIIKKKTWRCVECDYAQSFDPTQEAMDLQFNHNPGISLTNVQENECPSCVLRGKRGIQIKKETDPKKKTITTIMGEEDFEPEIDERSESLTTEAQKNAYRAKRKKDIADAIIAARKNEDK